MLNSPVSVIEQPVLAKGVLNNRKICSGYEVDCVWKSRSGPGETCEWDWQPADTIGQLRKAVMRQYEAAFETHDLIVFVKEGWSFKEQWWEPVRLDELSDAMTFLEVAKLIETRCDNGYGKRNKIKLQLELAPKGASTDRRN